MSRTKAKKKLFQLESMILAAGIIISQFGCLKDRVTAETYQNQCNVAVHDMNIGSIGIANPTSITSSAACWKGSYIYFGTGGYQWRVLDQSGFLFAEENLAYSDYHYQMSEATWETSSVRAYLNGYYHAEQGVDYGDVSFLSTYFTSGEQQIICETEVINEENPGLDPYPPRPSGNDTTDKLFFLSLSEIRKSSYGFASVATRITNGNRDIDKSWWLRTIAYKQENGASYVNIIGHIYSAGRKYFDETEKIGVRPAFNIDMSKVAFTTAADIDKQAYGTFGMPTGMVTNNFAAKNEWKLAIQETSESLNVQLLDHTVSDSGYQQLLIAHKSAAILQGTPQISAMLVDENGVIVHYGKVTNDVTCTESVITIPKNISPGEYTLKIFAERVSSGKLTDYVSEFSDISIIVDGIDVQEICGLPTEITAGESILLDGSIMPADATYQNIVYELVKDNGTDTILSGNVLLAQHPGKVTIKALIEKGKLDAGVYEQEIEITVVDPITDGDTPPSEPLPPGNGNPPSEDNTPPENGNPPSEDNTPPGNGNPPSEDNTPPESGNPPSDDNTPPGNGNPPTEDITPPESENPPTEDNMPPESENPPSDDNTPPGNGNSTTEGITSTESGNPPTDDNTPPDGGNLPAEEENVPSKIDRPSLEDCTPSKDENPPAKNENPPSDDSVIPEEENLPFDSNTSSENVNFPYQENLPLVNLDSSLNDSNPDYTVNPPLDDVTLPVTEYPPILNEADMPLLDKDTDSNHSKEDDMISNKASKRKIIFITIVLGGTAGYYGITHTLAGQRWINKMKSYIKK